MQTCPERCLVLELIIFLSLKPLSYVHESWMDHDDVIKWILSASLALFAGHTPVIGEFPSQRPVTRNFDIFFYLRPNKRLSKKIMRLVIWGAIALIMTLL